MLDPEASRLALYSCSTTKPTDARPSIPSFQSDTSLHVVAIPQEGSLSRSGEGGSSRRAWWVLGLCPAV